MRKIRKHWLWLGDPDRDLTLRRARKEYECAGNYGGPFHQKYHPLCTQQIRAKDLYVYQVTERVFDRGESPERKGRIVLTRGQRHCIYCASWLFDLQLFGTIKTGKLVFRSTP